MRISELTLRIGLKIKAFVAKLSPQHAFVWTLTLALTLISTVFTVAAYYKDYGNPRNTLASRGIPWNEERFFESLRTGDKETSELFLSGGMDPMGQADDRQLPIHLAKNQRNAAELLALLQKHGLDVNYPYDFQRSVGPQQNYLLFWAVFYGNTHLVEALLKAGARSDVTVRVITSPPSVGYDTTPLQIAKEQATSGTKSAASQSVLQLLTVPSKQ